jgi:Na+-translocating ferredoxin:NAD+ oxidoreductase RnfD subunit
LKIEIIGILRREISWHISLIFTIGTFGKVVIAAIHAEMGPGILPNPYFHILSQHVPCAVGRNPQAGIDPRVTGLG